jgi:hypothetical protein
MAAPLDITHMQQYNDIGHAVYISTCVYDATPLFIDIFALHGSLSLPLYPSYPVSMATRITSHSTSTPWT